MKKPVKYYNITDIINKFNKLSYKSKYFIVMQALDLMSSYNRYSKEYYIAEAMGYSNEEGCINTWIKNSDDDNN